MKKYDLERYEYGENDYRTMVVAYDTVYVAYIVMGGSGFDVAELTAGCSWREGADELIGVYETEKEADEAIERIMG